MALYELYRGSLTSDLEAELDALAFNGLAGVPFALHPALRAVQTQTVDRRIEALLQDDRPAQIQADVDRGRWAYEPEFELAIQADLLRQQRATEVQRAQAQAAWTAYEADRDQRRAEAAAQATQAAEAARTSPGLTDVNGHAAGRDEPRPAVENETGEAGSTERPTGRDPAPAGPVVSPVGPVTPAAPVPMIQRLPINPMIQRPPINFSEFEAESDPFESLALKSINDYQELAAVLATSHPSVPAVARPAPAPLAGHYAAGPERWPAYFSPPRYGAYASPPARAYIPPAGRPQSEAGPLKSSKSFGDLMSEIQKEALPAARVQATRTPPPRIVGPTPGVGPLADWIPWPSLEGDDPVGDLGSPAQRQLCRQIHAMGFPLARVVRVCRALPDRDGPSLIHFCLLVDRLIQATGLPEAVVEHGLQLQGGQEAPARRHLQAFRSLQPLGFDAPDIHQALVASQGDHDKALETLLKT